MSISQYCLTWDSHKNNICNGFASLQQTDEFVDMTLAADGYLVNVHKSILALASPYIRSMLQSSPSPHPVIFLSNISYEILNYILSYVYTGEVYVNVQNIQSFMKAAKDLRLAGLCSVPAPKVDIGENHERTDRDESNKRSNEIPNSVPSVTERTSDGAVINSMPVNTALPIEQMPMDISNLDYVDTEHHAVLSERNPSASNQTIENGEIQDIANNRKSGLYTTADGYQYKLEIPNIFDSLTESVFTSVEVSNDISDSLKTRNVTAKNEIPPATLPIINIESIGNTSSSTRNNLDPKALTPQYTMTSRGSLQLILNRYIYYCHHQSQGGRKRRWRCIDYRRGYCPAFIDTDCEVMTIRKFAHVHSFHDVKIAKKLKRNLLFTNLNCVLQKINNKT